MTETISTSTGTAQVAFISGSNEQPSIFVVREQTAQNVLTLNLSDYGLTAENATFSLVLAPDSSRLAIVISDASLARASVQVLNLSENLNEGKLTELHKSQENDRVSYLAWKPDGSALAYLRVNPASEAGQADQSEIWSVTLEGETTRLYGSAVLQFLGWSADGTHLHLTRRVEGLFAYSIVEVATGQAQDIFLPNDVEGSTDLNILGPRLSANGTRLAYVLNSSSYLQNCAATPVMIVEAQTGASLRELRANGAATGLNFSPDGNLLAFNSLQFPTGTDGTFDGKPDLDQQAALSGVQVVNLSDGSLTELVPARTGVGQYAVLGWGSGNTGLFIASDDGSVDFVDFAGNFTNYVQPSLQLDPGPSVGGDAGTGLFPVAGSVVNLDVPYIHQVKMTADEFDGNWACGPTSATMLAAYFHKLPPRGEVYMGNPSPYGWYISNTFNSPATNFQFGRRQNDASGRGATGAYGHCTDNGDGYAWRIEDYLRRLGFQAKFRTDFSFQLMKDYLNAGKPIVLSTNIRGFGHIVCLKGYTADGRWITNDPFWGKPGAGQVVYTWAELKGCPYIVTVDDAPGGGNPPPAQLVAAPVPPAPPLPVPSAAIGLVVGAGSDALATRFQAAYNRNGGPGSLGQPSTKVFAYNGRSLQNFRGGSRGEAVLVVDTRFDRPADGPVPTLQPGLGVAGAFLKAWRDTYGGSAGKLGSPLSDEFVNADGQRQQNFESGYILMQGQSDTSQGAFPWPTDFNGWKAEYYNNSGLAGSPAFVRNETPADNAGMNHDWGAGAPDGGKIGILADNFSARYTRTLDFGGGGTFNFVITADDGFRFSIDGQNVAGADPNAFWQISGPFPHSFRLNLSGGQHSLALEYLEAGGNALLRLDISPE